jgi:PGDYG protein
MLLRVFSTFISPHSGNAHHNSIMLELRNIDLTADPLAARYVKTETVTVTFAQQPGEIISLEGPNRYAIGDALITGSTGSRWSVSRARFDAKYAAVPPVTQGTDGAYAARPVPVLAKQITEPFAAARSAGGDLLRGNANDWLLQYGPGDFGVAEQQRFAQIYREIE